MYELSSVIESISVVPPWALALLLVWSMAIKGYSLWKSANGKQNYWFVAIFLINTLGILEAIYLLFFEKSRKKSKKK